MKKLLTIICLSILLTGCGNTKDTITMSNKAKSCGEQALEISSQYLSGDVSYDEAHSKLEALSNDMKYVNDQDFNDPNYSGDFSIASSITTIKANLALDNSSNNAESYDKLKKNVDDLTYKLSR